MSKMARMVEKCGATDDDFAFLLRRLDLLVVKIYRFLDEHRFSG